MSNNNRVLAPGPVDRRCHQIFLQPFGNAAHQALADQVAGQKVGIVVEDTDRYGRTVGVVYRDGRNISLALVEAGWVFIVYFYNNFSR